MAVDEMGLKKEETAFISGIGCSSRAPGYIITDSLHTTHGRALAFATGVKLGNPDLHVVVLPETGISRQSGKPFHPCMQAEY